MSFWRRPGYGDFLEQLTPGTRERMGEMGAPEGFEDAVAWLVETHRRRRAPPHWNVTFGVDDADAIASRGRGARRQRRARPRRCPVGADDDPPRSRRGRCSLRASSSHPSKTTRRHDQDHEQARFRRHPVDRQRPYARVLRRHPRPAHGSTSAEYEFWIGETCFAIWEPARFGAEFAPQKNAHPAIHVDDVAAARAELEAKGVEFFGEILDTGVCHMAFFTDPDGNDLMLHHRYAPRGVGAQRLKSEDQLGGLGRHVELRAVADAVELDPVGVRAPSRRDSARRRVGQRRIRSSVPQTTRTGQAMRSASRLHSARSPYSIIGSNAVARRRAADLVRQQLGRDVLEVGGDELGRRRRPSGVETIASACGAAAQQQVAHRAEEGRARRGTSRRRRPSRRPARARRRSRARPRAAICSAT